MKRGQYKGEYRERVKKVNRKRARNQNMGRWWAEEDEIKRERSRLGNAGRRKHGEMRDGGGTRQSHAVCLKQKRM